MLLKIIFSALLAIVFIYMVLFLLLFITAIYAARQDESENIK